MTFSADYIEDLAPYSSNSPPPQLSNDYQGFIYSSLDALDTAHPFRVDVIVAIPATKWSAAGHSVVLHTFAKFRKSFTIIEDLAPALAQVYLQTGILPIINPVRAHRRTHIFEIEPRLAKAISGKGLKLYVRPTQ